MSEKLWESIEIKRGIYGFQTQKGTKWLDGLSEVEIKEFESEVGFQFPEIYKFYLRNMNGTDKPAKNIYGNEETVGFSPNFFSYPRDLKIIRDRINWIYDEFLVDEEVVKRQRIPHIIPIVSHRFLVADNCAENPVLSMFGKDVIVYAPNLQFFLVAEIFRDGAIIPTNLNYEIKFWLDENLEFLNE
ncbi:MAG TPA: SMI1/KNR4 family protein [Pyrinomonadaceae bacterium]